MDNARRPIPRRPHVPLHVAVKRVHIPFRIDGNIELIAETAAKQLDLSAFGIGLDDVSARSRDAGRMTVGIPHPR